MKSALELVDVMRDRKVWLLRLLKKKSLVFGEAGKVLEQEEGGKKKRRKTVSDEMESPRSSLCVPRWW